MKKYILSIIIFCSMIFFSGVGIFSLNYQIKLLASDFAYEVEMFKDESPQDITELQNATDDQLNYWADHLSSFDGRDYNYITPARNQAKKNLCWVYSSIGAVEANILRNGIDRDATSSSLDFDEVVTAYARYNRDGSEDPLGLTTNDTYSSETWNKGGNALDAFSIMTQGYCLVNNDATLGPYTSSDVIKSKLETSRYYIKDYMFIENNINAIKRAIMKYGAVTINYKQPPAKKTYIYDEDKSTINHSSLIVGWDDFINKDLFYPNKPTQNGAWIVKNSWGIHGTDKNGDGACCYYLSYESYINDNIFATDVAMRKDYQNIYFYDGKLTDKTLSDKVDAQASIYKAQLSDNSKQEQLKAVMIATSQSVYANIKIYKNSLGNSNDIGNELNRLYLTEPDAEIDVELKGKGMHSVDLPTLININKDEYCYIIVCLKDKNQNTVAVTCAEESENSTNDMTYYLSNGNWQNLKTMGMSARIRLITNTTEKTTKDINSINLTLDVYNYEYDGHEKQPKVIAIDGEKTLELYTDFEVEYQNNTNAGKASAIIKGIKNYTGTKTLYFTIQKANRDNFKVVLNDWTYGDNPSTPSIQVQIEDSNVIYTYSDSINGTYTTTKPTNAGTYWIKAVIEQSQNYNSAEAKTQFTISKAEKPFVNNTTIHVNYKANKLSDIQLPSGFVWEDSELKITSNKMTAKAIYNGEDAESFVTKEVYFEIIFDKQSNSNNLIWFGIVFPAACLILGCIIYTIVIYKRNKWWNRL